MAGPVVSIERGPFSKEMLSKAVERVVDLRGFIKSGSKVLITPNMTSGMKPETGSTTKPEIVKAVVELAWEAGAGKVVVGESAGAGTSTEFAFENTGIGPAAEEAGAELLDWDEDEVIEVPVEQPMEFSTLSLPKSIFDCDILIALPVLKTHHFAGISVSLKKMYGAILPKKRKMRNHVEERDIEKIIVDLNTARRADLVVVDGIVGMEGLGPCWGDPVETNCIVVGTDPVAVDSVCAQVMGLDSDKVLHLKWAAEKGLGVNDVEKIRVVGAPVDEVRRAFLTPFDHALKLFKNIRGHTEGACNGCYGRMATVLLYFAMAGTEGGYNKETIHSLNEADPIDIWMGPNKEVEGNRSLVIGDCLSDCKNGVFIDGCPPDMFSIFKGLMELGYASPERLKPPLTAFIRKWLKKCGLAAPEKTR